MHIGDNRRHARATVIAVVLFLFFDLLALGLNFWLTARIEAQAIGINLAGRQRMLSQRMVKVLLQFEHALETGTSYQHELAELQLTYMLFDRTLQGFDQGHLTLGGNSDELFLPPVESPTARHVVDEAVILWRPYRVLVSDVIESSTQELPSRLTHATDYAEQHNLQILELMNRLTSELERQTQNEASRVRLYQGGAFVLALINFFCASLLYARRIRSASRREDLLDEIINKISASVIVMDTETRIIRVNRSAQALFGYQNDELLNRQLNELVRGAEGNQIGYRKDGSTFLAQTEQNEVRMDDRRLLIETIIDVTRQRMTEQRLSSLAYTDLLTGLPNRLLFDDRLHVELARAQRNQKKLGVLFIDLDYFKRVNDQFGHETGDLLLREVANRLQGSLRESDTISRRGGDEFTALIADAEGYDALARVADMIVERLKQPFVIEGQSLSIGCSVGASLFPDDGGDPAELLLHADEAMYCAKKTRGRYSLYRDMLGSSPASCPD